MGIAGHTGTQWQRPSRQGLGCHQRDACCSCAFTIVYDEFAWTKERMRSMDVRNLERDISKLIEMMAYVEGTMGGWRISLLVSVNCFTYSCIPKLCGRTLALRPNNENTSIWGSSRALAVCMHGGSHCSSEPSRLPQYHRSRHHEVKSDQPHFRVPLTFKDLR
jgi:hypothetical protein